MHATSTMAPAARKNLSFCFPCTGRRSRSMRKMQTGTVATINPTAMPIPVRDRTMSVHR